MEFEGLISGYPVNRPLTQQELDDHLPIDRRADIEPHQQLAAIRGNSTFLELTDKFFGWRGLLTLVAVIAIGISLFAIVGTVFAVFSNIERTGRSGNLEDYFTALAVTLITLPLIGLGLWFLLSESFSLTHFPIRFNRRNRIVYVFRTDGTVLSASWDALFFTLGRQPKGSGLGLWEVRGHVLDTDGKTVRETFALPFAGVRHEPMLLSLWEFVRRYMEEGPQDIVPRIGEYANRISDRRESFSMGLQRLWVEGTHGMPVIAIIGFMAPFLFLIAITRQFAKWTSRIPVWPAEVEAACAVEPDDPYVKE